MAEQKNRTALSLRERGHSTGALPTGPLNHILDVPGVGVAHRTLKDPGSAVCSGFTVLQPSAKVNARVTAAVHALNGAGELTGSFQIREWGFLDTPIVLTNTPGVGRAYDLVTDWMFERDAGIGEKTSVVIPVVGECDDSVLHDPRKKAWGREQLFAALDEALELAAAKARGDKASLAGATAQGDVGGGTGMISFELKAGIGSASRKVSVRGREYVVGVLLQANFGRREQLTVLGRQVGRALKAPLPKEHREGSCLAVLATDAPLGPLGLERLAKRIGLGLARTGSHAHHGSGEIFLAFSTAGSQPHALDWDREEWNPLLQASVEAAEESVYNSLFCAGAVENSRASVCALKYEEIADLLRG